jgi:integrase
MRSNPLSDQFKTPLSSSGTVNRSFSLVSSFPRNVTLPYFFSEEEINRIFSVISNLKHLCMLQVLFYSCLRATELCNLDDEDLDLNNQTLRMREGKGGREGYDFITNDCAPCTIF